MKKMIFIKNNIYTILFAIMAVLFAAYCVDRYIIEIGTTMSAGTLLSTMFANGGIIPWIKNDKFTTMTEEDIGKLEAENLGKYHKALSEHKEAELKALVDAKASKAELEKAVKELNTQLAGLKETAENTELKDSIEAYKTEMQKQIDEAGVAITKLSEGGSPAKVKTLRSIIKEAIESEDITAYREKGGVGTSAKVALNVKAVIDYASFVGDVVTPEKRGPAPVYQPPKKFDIRDAIQTGQSDTDSIDHDKETGMVDAAGFLAENTASPESTLNLEQVKTSSKRIATHVPTSKKSLRNVSYLTTHISNRFAELIAVKITDSVLNGTGAGNAFDGFFNNAVTFTAGALANKVDEANMADVLAAAIARLAEITNLQATAIFINPLDEFLLTATKDTTGNYAESNVVVTRINGKLHINGVPTYSTFHVAADTYLIADLSSTTTELLEVEGLSMWIADQHGTDAVENKVTFIFEMEAILPIYRTFAFLKGTISTDKALLETA